MEFRIVLWIVIILMIIGVVLYKIKPVESVMDEPDIVQTDP